MLQPWMIVTAGFGYLCLLFAVAYWGDKRALQRRSLVASPYVYALSIAVYCTAWTFYGSVGRAATSGIDFLPIYLGPTLVAILWWHLLRKILRISKNNRITSIADFVATRYGKSQLLGGLVTVIAMIVITPYIALQLKGVSTSFNVLMQYPRIVMPSQLGGASIFQDTALYVALVMAAFSILYGTRHIDATEQHEGMVAAVAFESTVKLIAFLAVGLSVTYGIFDGFGDIFARAAERPEIAKLLTGVGAGGYGGWVTLTILSMAAILFLPRQFQITVVENERAPSRQGRLVVPALSLLINMFVLPIAFGGFYFPADGGRRYLRADAADGRAAGAAGAAGVHRRAVGGDRDGDRRDHRALDHGLQRPADADPAARGLAAPDRARRFDPPADRHPPAAFCSCCSWDISTSISSAGPTRSSASGCCRSRPWRSSRRRSSAEFTGCGRRAPARSPGSPPGSRSGSIRCFCRRSRNRAGCRCRS